MADEEPEPTDHTDVEGEQSEPSKRREKDEHDAPFQESEDTIADLERSTAPQSPYTIQQVGIGFAVLLLGLVVTFGLPFLVS